MRISKSDLDWAVSQEVIEAGQAEALWRALEKRGEGRPSFNLQNVLYYCGALIVIGAMGWFMGLAWESFGGAGLFGIATGYGLVFLLIGKAFWNGEGHRIPGGLLVTMAVCMTPLAIYGLQRMIGVWPQDDPGVYRGFHVWIKGGWFFMEVGTILVGLAALRFFRFPFLTAPVAFTLWYMSMDVGALIVGREPDLQIMRQVSLWFGLAMLAVTYFIDRRTKEDFAFWGYLFGLMAFWGGLSAMDSNSEWSKLAYCGINVALMLLSILLDRRVFIVFGAFGVCGYLFHLADLFSDSMLFPFTLSLFGLAVIFLGVLYQRHHQAIESFVISLVPEGVRRGLPPNR